MTTEKLLSLKKQIDKAKEELSELKGKKQALLETLKTDFNCSFDEIDKIKKKLRKKVEQLEEEKEGIIEKLEQDYDF